ncbi:MAG: hypothetical protein ACI4QT_00020, partial [Kiritimatiellia bacterium]
MQRHHNIILFPHDLPDIFGWIEVGCLESFLAENVNQLVEQEGSGFVVGKGIGERFGGILLGRLMAAPGLGSGKKSNK